MSRLAQIPLWIATWAVALAACGDERADRGGPAPAPGQDGAVADASDTCALPSDCTDIELLGMTTKACCSPAQACGYELPQLDDAAKMDYPGVDDLHRDLT